jgi:hypothetical protein
MLAGISCIAENRQLRQYPMSDGRLPPFALQANSPTLATYVAALMDRATAPVFS